MIRKETKTNLEIVQEELAQKDKPMEAILVKADASTPASASNTTDRHADI